MNPVLITGGAGFVGRYLAAVLTGAGRPVTVLDDLSSPPTHSLPGGRFGRVAMDVGDGLVGT